MPQFTKYALENSLKKLLLQKPLNKITINDITEDCGINRMTFYYHFKDIYDLVEWVCMEDAKKALADNKTYETWQQGFVRIFDAVRENKPFIMNVYRCVSREQVEKYLTPLTDDLLMGVINELSAGMVVRAEDKAFYCAGLFLRLRGSDAGLDQGRDEAGPGNAGKSVCPRDSGRRFLRTEPVPGG